MSIYRISTIEAALLQIVYGINVSIVHIIDTVISPMTIQHVSLIMIYKYLLHVYNLNKVETKMINVFGNNQ